MVLPGIAPAVFVAKWKAFAGNERSGYASHFDDLCDLLGHLKPAAADPSQQRFCFQRAVMQDIGRIGFADVYYEGRFGWEYKGNHKDLDAAY